MRYLSLIFYPIICFLFLSSCSDSKRYYDNSNLLDIDVNFRVNLNLPQFNSLNYPMNPVFIVGYGNKGVIIVNTGSDNYVAFDAADPNLPLKDCSVLKIEGIEGTSQCEERNTYNLISGTAIEDKSESDNLEYALKPYQVIDNGDGSLTVKN